MKKTRVYFYIFSIAIFIFIMMFSYGSLFLENKILKTDKNIYLSDLSKAQTQLINEYFLENQKNIEILRESDSVKQILKEQLIVDENLAKNEIKRNSQITSKEIENFLISKNNLTLEELLGNNEFKEISIKFIENSGFSAIYEFTSEKWVLHPDSNLINSSIRTNKSEEYLKLINVIKSGENHAEGFYNEGVKKFSTFDLIRIKTKDNKILVLVTTINSNEYKTVQNVSLKTENYLNKIKTAGNYHTIFFLSNRGYLIYELSKTQLIGLNANNEDLGLKEGFYKIKSTNVTQIIGPNYNFAKNHKHFVFYILTPIYENNNILGYLGTEIEAENIYKLIEKNISFGNTTKIYTINYRGLLSSPINENEKNILLQEIKSTNSENCLISYITNKSNTKISEFENFEGDEVIGIYSLIPSLNSCLLIETESEDFNKTEDQFKTNIYFLLILIIFLFLINIFINKYINKNYIIKEKRKQAKNIFFEKLININSKKFLIFYSLFLISYLIIISNIFGGFNIKIFLHNCVDLGTAFFMGIIFINLKKFKMPYKIDLFFGILLIALSRLAETLIQQYEFAKNLTTQTNFWLIVVFMFIFGIMFMIKSFNEVKND